ncbi:hypothetical protein [uncultured Mycolicibacterium sp.]|uniref:hypothetical protein n=1 Tax=uncultured Mycolicibacterium sp. TaxID=2320817 RepID=UPI002618C0EC|nr:hypothetical protein [uncultured Mycolicibacterium sp.]
MTVDRVAELLRWTDAGGRWQVVGRRGGTVTVALLRCDGGEEAGRFSSADPRLVAWLGDRTSSEE